jgi:hypothetical protein
VKTSSGPPGPQDVEEMVRGYELVTVYRKAVGGAEYLAKFTASLDGAIKDGYIVPADRGALLAQAGAVQFPAA